MFIDLNFLPLETSEFTIPVFRSRFNGEPRQDGFFAAQLPTSETGGCDSEYAYYRVGLSNYEGATPYIFHANENPRLMTSIMWYYLKQWAKQLIDEFNIKAYIVDRFEKFISFIVEELPKGQRVVKIYPYYLGVTEQYGVLLEFAFKKKPNVPFDREIQQLSFSLDRAGKSNVNSYLDRLNYIQNFIKTKLLTYGTLTICGQEYSFSSKLTRLQ